jgi:hypothetical protein
MGAQSLAGLEDLYRGTLWITYGNRASRVCYRVTR